MFPADSNFTDWMSWFLGNTRTPEPFTLGEWRVATDGRVAACVKGSGVSCPLREPEFININKALTIPALKTVSFPWAELVELIGPAVHPEMETCDLCGGTNEIQHHCNCNLCEEKFETCHQCDGNGNSVSDHEPRPRRIFGRFVDANLVAYVLAHAPKQPDVRIEFVKDDSVTHIAIFRLVTADWTGLVVGLATPDDREAQCVELLPQEVSNGLLHH